MEDYVATYLGGAWFLTGMFFLYIGWSSQSSASVFRTSLSVTLGALLVLGGAALLLHARDSASQSDGACTGQGRPRGLDVRVAQAGDRFWLILATTDDGYSMSREAAGVVVHHGTEDDSVLEKDAVSDGQAPFGGLPFM